jgi:hypothetical protein
VVGFGVVCVFDIHCNICVSMVGEKEYPCFWELKNWNLVLGEVHLWETFVVGIQVMKHLCKDPKLNHVVNAFCKSMWQI